MPTKRLTWRKKKPERYRMEEQYDLFMGDVRLGSAARLHLHSGYYWYARDDDLRVVLKNTAHTPVATMDQAKADCMAYVRSCLAAKATP